MGLILFGFIPEPVFTFIPESCSESSRNRVHLAPDSPARPCGELSRLREGFYEATRTYKRLAMQLDLGYDRLGFNTAYLNVENTRKVLETARARL